MAGDDGGGPRAGDGRGARMLIDGEWIGRGETIDVANPFDGRLVALEPEAPEAEFCTECGALRQDEGRFCVVCGHPFGGVAEPPKPEVEITWPEAGAEAPNEEPAEEHSEQE